MTSSLNQALGRSGQRNLLRFQSCSSIESLCNCNWADHSGSSAVKMSESRVHARRRCCAYHLCQLFTCDNPLRYLSKLASQCEVEESTRRRKAPALRCCPSNHDREAQLPLRYLSAVIERCDYSTPLPLQSQRPFVSHNSKFLTFLQRPGQPQPFPCPLSSCVGRPPLSHLVSGLSISPTNEFKVA